MGRLFWKFFFFIWLAQLSAMLGIGATFWLHDRAREQRQDDIDLSPPAAFLVAAAAATLEHGGLPGLRGLLEGARRDPVYALADDDRELLGRPVAPAVIAQARSLLAQGGWQPRVRRVTAPDGSGYVLFAPMTERHRGRPPLPDGGAGQPFPGGRPPPDDGPPGGGRAWLPVLPIAATVLANLLFAGLARYVASRSRTCAALSRPQRQESRRDVRGQPSATVATNWRTSAAISTAWRRDCAR
jgi:two-component system OmpR family sensor kinase